VPLQGYMRSSPLARLLIPRPRTITFTTTASFSIFWHGSGSMAAETKKCLSDLIHGALVRSGFGDNEELFLPKGCIDSLVTKEAIKDELEDADDNLVHFIVSRAKKVFAIALLCNVDGSKLLKAMESFKAHEFCDEDLPIKCPRAGFRDFEAAPPAFSTSAWRKDVAIFSFWKVQWQFLAPDFSTNAFRHTLSATAILPFTWRDNTVKEGTFGKVFQGQIHEGHQEDLRNARFKSALRL
jgi:hypothetical protein